MERAVAHQSSDYVQTISSPEIVNFAMGQPGGAIIPKRIIDDAFVRPFVITLSTAYIVFLFRTASDLFGLNSGQSNRRQ
jgi:hypothetical protein